MRNKRELWKRWMASVLCIAMALSLYPQQAAMAEEQKPEEGTNPVVCEQADYDGVEPTWGDWTEKEGQPGDWIVTAVLNCKKCGGKASGHSQEMEVAILQEETKPASCTEEGLRTFKASVERNGQKLENPTPKEVAIPAKGHTYGEPVWNWIMTGEENTATAEFACKACQNKCAENAKVESVSHQEATCTAPGKTVYKATVTIPEAEQSQFEKASYENTKPMEEAAKGHKYGEPVWNWIMTGEEKTATAEFTCKACQNKRTENAKVESDSHQEATCTTPGKTVYKATIAIPEPEKSQFEKVSYEDTKTIEEAAKGHAYGAPVWRWSLTGEEKTAIAEFRCKVCQDKRTENAKMESNVQEATCTTPGGIFYKATVAIPEADQPQFEKSSYEDKRTIEEEPAKGHAYGEPVWGEWSVDEQTGECQITATFTCANGCGETIEKTVTGREISRKNPTCTENGSVSYQAQVGIGVPGETALSPVYEKLIPTEGHGYAISGSAWRWDAEKSAYYVEVTTVCAKCQEENVLAVPAQKEVKQATCTEAGEIAYTAKVQVGSVEYPMSMAIWMPAEGHEYGEPEWGLSEDHKTVTAVMTCTKCAEGTEGHRMEGSAEPKEEIVPANCTQAGKATYMASVVIGGKTYTKQIELAIPAAGHKMKKTDAKAATCDKDGNTAYSACEVCKKYFSDEEGKREIAKDSWVVKKKGHKIKSVVAAKATKTKAGSLKRKCKVCGKVEETIQIPKTELEINIGGSAKVVKDPKKCKVSLKNASSYKKYLTLDANKGTIKTKKDYSVKFKESIPLTVKIADKTYTVNVKIKIPAPKVAIKRTKIGDSYYRYTFQYNIKGADRIRVRCNRKDAKVEVLDRYLSKPKSDGDSYVNIRQAENEKVTFTIVAFYGKNASKKLEITK